MVLEEDEIEVDESLVFNPESFPVERYKPLKALGQGAGGAVYLCRDLLLNKLVALKTLHVLSGEQLVAFQNEARLLSKLDHPNIVRILDFGATKGGAPYMVLEHSSGSSLRDAITRNGALPPESVKQIFTSLADALSYCHEREVFHRDLKPENILFTKDADQATTVKLIDFGIATLVTQEKTHFNGRELVGTPAYMPPDQMRGLNYDQRSEIYSLGCVMFEAITGHPVFTGETALEILSKHANEMPPKLSDFTIHSIPLSMQNILSTCLSKEPATRFQSMQDLKKALSSSTELSDQKTDLSPTGTHLVTDVERVDKRVFQYEKLLQTMIALALLVLVGIASFIFLAFTFKGTESKHIERAGADAPRKSVSRKSYKIVNSGKVIFISGEHITTEAFKEVADICKQRCSLTFENQPQNVTWSGLSELENAPIGTLVVQATTFGDNECKIVARFSQLVRIDLSYTDVTDKGIETLCTSKSLSQFIISSSKATGECIKYLADVPGISMLEMDSLPHVKLSDLQNLRRCRNLQLLNVGHDFIGDEGFRTLCKIDSLRDLSVDTCNITDAGTSALVGTKLTRISLADNSGITDKTIPFLLKLPNLEEFRYGQSTRITAGGEKILQSAKPNLEIRNHQGLVVRPRVMDGVKDLQEMQMFEKDLFGDERN